MHQLFSHSIDDPNRRHVRILNLTLRYRRPHKFNYIASYLFTPNLCSADFGCSLHRFLLLLSSLWNLIKLHSNGPVGPSDWRLSLPFIIFLNEKPFEGRPSKIHLSHFINTMCALRSRGYDEGTITSRPVCVAYVSKHDLSIPREGY